MVLPVKLASVRPLVRYVDEDLAVVDAHFTATPALLESARDALADHADPRPAVTVHVEITNDAGFFDEGDTPLRLDEDRHGSVRFEIHAPHRWWPAGMGDQSLYTLTLTLFANGDIPLDTQHVTFGLSSVRRDHALGQDLPPNLLVHGRICDIQDVLVIDRVDEKSLLPATGESLLLVRDHYGPDALYRAADHAGILLVQCVPVDETGRPTRALTDQLDRLAPHPSLAGYYVGHLGDLAERVVNHLKQLDPTRAAFRKFPLDPAA